MIKKFNDSIVILMAVFLMFLLVLVTVPYDLLDVTDLNDYSDTAKFFAGEYRAKHRSTHSIFYGAMLSPYIELTKSFSLIKFAPVFWIILTILSIYYISKKNRKTLLLFLTCPLVWYLGPWLTPVLPSGFLFLWAYYFMKKFDSDEKLKYIIYSALTTGIASAFWDTSLYFALIFMAVFLYDKKFYFSWIFLLSLFIGLIPRLLIDFLVFGSPFYGIIKNTGALVIFALYGGAYSQGYSTIELFRIIDALIFIPFFFYILYSKKKFVKYKKVMIFITLSLLFILLMNPQPRPLFVIVPIIILLLGEEISNSQFKKQIIIFIIISLLAITPYLIQSKYETNLIRFTVNPEEYKNLKISSEISNKLIIYDLEKIGKEYPNQVFVVGNDKDYYRKFAHFYWGDEIAEFVSIEDYELFLKGEDTIASWEFRSNSRPDLRREIWLKIGLGKNSNDNTDYEGIKYGLSLDNKLNLEGFEYLKKYNKIYLFIKTPKKFKYPA